MTHHQPLLDALTRAWAGDCDLLIAQYVEGCRFIDKAFDLAHEGHEGLREVFAFTFTIMPDFRVTYGQSVFSADRGAAEWIFTGTFCGDFKGRHFDGVPVTIAGVSFMSLHQGKIMQNADYWNVGHLELQLGSSV